MQNRYVGDVGDFAKYALLRRLAGTSPEQSIRLGVVWCLYPDESHNADGRHISYLSRPGFAPLDLDLISALQKLLVRTVAPLPQSPMQRSCHKKLFSVTL